MKEMKNSFNCLGSRLDTTKERISESGQQKLSKLKHFEKKKEKHRKEHPELWYQSDKMYNWSARKRIENKAEDRSIKPRKTTSRIQTPHSQTSENKK